MIWPLSSSASNRAASGPAPAASAPNEMESELTLGAVVPLDIRPAEQDPDQVWPRDQLQPPAFTLDFGDAADGRVSIRAATLRGNNHLHLQQPRQDAYAVLVTDDMIHLAVADGVGSEDHSDIGARVAVSEAVRASRSGMTSDQIGQTVANAIQAEADQMGIHSNALSTTLCWARISIGETGKPWDVEVTEWGDTETLVYDTHTLKAGHPRWLRLPKTERLANSVFALPRHQVVTASTSHAQWGPGQVFGLFTDGVASDVRHDTVLGHALAKAWHSVPTPWEFAGHLAFRYRPANDDRTALVLWRTDHSQQTAPAESTAIDDRAT